MKTNTINHAHRSAHQVQCRMRYEEAAMERLLQVVRIRGFALQELQVEREPEAYRIALTVAGERPIDYLLRQLEKLHSVMSVVSMPGAGSEDRTRAALRSA